MAHVNSITSGASPPFPSPSPSSTGAGQAVMNGSAANTRIKQTPPTSVNNLLLFIKTPSLYFGPLRLLNYLISHPPSVSKYVHTFGRQTL
ncbi:hypothetical protein ES708_32594 [subsurface metagenome]